MLKFLNNESKSIVGAASIVGVLSLVSRLMGFIRDRVLAGTFGAGEVLDAYYAAFKVPDFLFGLIVIGSLSAGFIPVFAKYWNTASARDRAWKLTNNVFGLVMVSMGVLCFVLAVCAPLLVPFVAPGFSGEKQELVVQFMRIMFGAQVLLAGSLVFGSALQGMKRFVLYSSAPVLYNAGIIFGALWFVPVLGPVGLAWGVVLGAAFHVVIQTIGMMAAGYRFRPTLHLTDADTKEILVLTGPRVVGLAVSQLIIFVLMVMATTLPEGSVTVFQFAYNIQFLPVGIIGVSFAIAAFPSFSEHLERHDVEGFVRVFGTSVRQVLFFILPLMMVFLAVRAQIVRVVVGAGAFDWAATIATADALAFFALSFISQCLVYVLARAFFALRDTMTPLVAGLVAGLVGILSAFLLRDAFGVAGLAASFSLASFVNMVLLWVPLHQRFGSLGESRWLFSVYRSIACALVALVCMQMLKQVTSPYFPLDTFWNVFLHGFIAGMGGLVVYTVLSALLRSEELEYVLAGVRKRFRKIPPVEAVTTDAPAV